MVCLFYRVEKTGSREILEGQGKTKERFLTSARADRLAEVGRGKNVAGPVRGNDGDGKASDLIRIGERKHYKGWAARECGSGGKGAGFDAGVRA